MDQRRPASWGEPAVTVPGLSGPGELCALAARVTGGDGRAGSALRRRLEPQLVPIVRRAIRRDAVGTPLARRICALAREVAGGRGLPAADDRLVAEVARRLCESILANLRPGLPAGGPAAETVRGR